MLHTVLTNTRLTGETRAFFKSHTYDFDHDSCVELSDKVMLETFKDALATGLYQEFSPQYVLKAAALACARLDDQHVDTVHSDDFTLYLNCAKRFVQAWIADAVLLYHPARGYRNSKGADAETPAYYCLAANTLRRVITDLLHDAPTVDMRFIKEGSKHHKGAIAMSAHKFSINISRAKECKEWLDKGYYLNRKGYWQQCTKGNAAEEAKLEQQRQTMQQAREAYKAHPHGWHFEVKADFRGRLYYVSGMLNPQAGGVASYILEQGSYVTYDSTASFAQFIAIVTGDSALAGTCNLRNYSGTVQDFYGSVYAMAAGTAVPAKDSFTRAVAKAYLMPKAYGSGDETSRDRAIQMAQDEGQSIEEATTIVDALQGYDGLNTVKNAASAAAQMLAEAGKQLEWTTPSGFEVKQNYWELTSREWNTGHQFNEYIPTRITFKERTGRVAVDRESSNGNRSAVVAAAANFIQSLDAAFMALVQHYFHEETGSTIVGVHDSFTFREEYTEDFKRIAWRTFCEIAHSPELSAMRQTIGLAPHKDLIWLDVNRIPHFVDQE